MELFWATTENVFETENKEDKDNRPTKLDHGLKPEL